MSKPPRQLHAVKRKAKHASAKGQGKADNELIWGIHPVSELLKREADRIIEIIAQQKSDSKKINAILEQAEKQSIAVRRVGNIDRECFRNRISPDSHQGVVARVRPFETVSLGRIINKVSKEISQGDKPVVLVLDSIQDPHNLGAILRSALAAGVTGVVLPKDRSAPLSGTVAKASAGALAHLDICRVTNISQTIQQLKDEGLWVFGAAGETEQTIYQADFSSPVCLVIGGEEKGIRKLVREQCDFLVSIPMQSDLNSLNASVAAGIILFEIVRQQQVLR
jgi:23S rRNA (guanosine2251-2'-O)-methyltransferase